MASAEDYGVSEFSLEFGLISNAKVISIGLRQIASNLNQLPNNSSSPMSSNVQDEVDRVRDLMTNRLIWKFNAALQCAGR